MLAVISGGSASGKSEYAESLAISMGIRRLYIATMEPFDGECVKRIARHREMRKEKGFETLEVYTRLKDAPIPPCDIALLECMSNLLANEMYSPKGSGEDCVGEILLGLESLCRAVPNVVVVTNEVFSDGCAYDESTMGYIEYLGQINRALVQRADYAAEVAAGIPIVHKGRRPRLK